ncbi:PucR family transcriptional regulator [Nonomuraea insulae]|uniref:PucR family transcriptional regulator n=1 Tax=Nonomuraea insulae TaxID=1616787 RepID=A0ABW1D5Q1_9ACTN
MGDLLRTLGRRVEANAERAVEACVREIPDYQAIAPVAWDSMVDVAVVSRNRMIELVDADLPLQERDLAFAESAGEQRGAQGVSPAGQRGALALHSALVLRDISEAAGPGDLDDTMHALDWLVRHGGAARAAYTRGYFRGQVCFLPVEARVQHLVAMLLCDDPAAAELAKSLGMPVSERYIVTVIRVAEPRGCRQEVAVVMVEEHRVPLGWCEPGEFVALVPYRGGDPAAEGRVLAIGRDVAAAVGRPCSVGTAVGRLHALAVAVALARKVARVAPIERVPRRPYGMGDVFAELAAVQTPEVDGWLREVAQRLAGGPDLVITLDAYYRSDMNRTLASTSLHIHPRTLDYRLRRVRDLVGIEPGSTRGVRVLSTAVTRALAGAWEDPGTP